ncbi:Diacylglycerol pyrophosphate phosphatase 1 [Purpureocillium lavendulum]|uniref:Diacylglycerol pyrophosphate phosphatase 1 n=1 Tax=Purpureocillium lavendulum TaxID=1247861 RepID=A0AB34FIZ1_9HYPO|nr:Diacylglycerol pyrophosphate phosphatase 1 [Purpureocillium lavendulum]
MFLHSGASLHGHEYSSRRSSNAPLPPPKRHPLLRTALRPLAPSEPNFAAEQTSNHDIPPPPPPRRRHTLDLPGPSSLSSRHRPSSNSSARRDLAVRFREPGMDSIQTPLVSEDEESIVGSELSDSTDASIRRAKRKRVPRHSTRFALAHPAPQLRTKQRMLVQIRPRLLLQLQEVGDRRAIPAFDVIPSSLIAGTLIIPRLAKRFPRMFGAKPELAQDDVLVVRSDDYELSTPASPSQPKRASRDLDNKDVLAVIGPGSQESSNSAEIVLDDGSTWLANLMANGSYEFTHVDEFGSTYTARWVRRVVTSKRNSSASMGASTPTSVASHASHPVEHKWTFSIIDPSSKRHPIMGSLTSESVEIYDTYTTLSTSSGRYPPTRSFSAEVSGSTWDQAPHPAPRRDERSTAKVTREQKRLMLATATWISLHRQGWPASANPKFARSAACRSPSRRQSYPVYPGEAQSRSTSPVTSSQHADGLVERPPASPSPPRPSTTPARAMSTGRAFMTRRNGRAAAHDEHRLSDMSQQSSEKSLADDEEEARCRPKVRPWLHRLFHRKKRAGKDEELARYKLDG